jgi:hypothetical protein
MYALECRIHLLMRFVVKRVVVVVITEAHVCVLAVPQLTLDTLLLTVIRLLAKEV